MADEKVTDLTELAVVAASDDWLYVVDKSDTTDDAAGSSEKIAMSNIPFEYMVPIWAEENAALGDNTYEWAFGNGANTPSNTGIAIYVPTGWTCTVVAMSATTNSASGTSVIEANINGTLQGANCNVTISGRSGTNDSFTPVSISNGDRLTFRTTTAGTNSSPSTVTAWLRYVNS